MDEQEVYILRETGREGPYSESELFRLIEAGGVDREDEVVFGEYGEPRLVAELFERLSGPESPSEWEPAEEIDDSSAAAEPPPPAVDRDSDLRSERLIFAGRPSWLKFWRGAALSVASLAGGTWAWERNGWFLFGALLLTLAFYLRACLIRAANHYLVTNRRVERVYGLLSRSSHEVRVQDVRTINVRKTGFLGLLGVGSVDFSSSGGDGVEVVFADIWRPHRVKARVRSLQDAEG